MTVNTEDGEDKREKAKITGLATTPAGYYNKTAGFITTNRVLHETSIQSITG